VASGPPLELPVGGDPGLAGGQLAGALVLVLRRSVL
jgi:hypothetical protein